LRVYYEDMADEQISAAMIRAIRNPFDEAAYREDLKAHFDVDGDFQGIIISPSGRDTMDTVDRRRLSYRLQLYLEDITHNGNFFYYDSHFVLVINDVTPEETDGILSGFLKRTAQRMSDREIFVGVGSRLKDISRLHISFKRALAAERYNRRHPGAAAYFDSIGINRLFYSVDDTALIKELGEDVLAPLIEYDRKYPGGDYVSVLQLYLESNGSVQAVAEKLFTHRNTVIYRMNKIRQLLQCDLTDPADRTRYLIACLILNETLR
ncbi:MAG: helix-turn-helix domain-containing protein, partial [Lachnospiraceae bacterium]|nr:helix-turn-helix domain-containing protein [Lachnospiraceae bacterium]